MLNVAQLKLRGWRGLFAAGIVGAGVLITPADAAASFSGMAYMTSCGVANGAALTYQSLYGGISFVPLSDGCGIGADGTASWFSGSAAGRALSMPLIRNDSSTDIVPLLYVWGGDGSSASRPLVCGVLYTYDEVGNFAGGTSVQCTTGSGHNQWLAPLSWIIPLPAAGAAIFNFTAEKQGAIHTARVGWGAGSY